MKKILNVAVVAALVGVATSASAFWDNNNGYYNGNSNGTAMATVTAMVLVTVMVPVLVMQKVPSTCP